jgi:hypothetical protein
MKLMLSIVIPILLLACEKSDFIYYEYEDNVVTRHIQGVDNYFYYGYCDGKKVPCPSEYYKIYYQGYHGLISLYLIFDNYGKVGIEIVAGYRNKVGNMEDIYFMESTNPKFIQWRDSIQGNFNNVVYLSHVLEKERKMNKQNHSKVKVTYPNE